MSKFIVVVECAIECDKKFLIIKRPEGKHAENLLSFPGGKVEITDGTGSNDVLVDAVKREVFEELGLQLKDPIRYVISSYFVDTKVQQHVIDVIFHCEIKDAPGNLIVSKDEVPEHGWMTYDEIIKADNCPDWLLRYLNAIILKRKFEHNG